jgi:hypothetical protein
MIRIRSAFMITLLGCILAFCLGLNVGFLSARSNTLLEGMKKWGDDMVMTFPIGSGNNSGDGASDSAPK